MDEKERDKELDQLAEIQDDLNATFPFAALWQDEQETGLAKMFPLFNLIIGIIMLILVIILLTKV